MRAPGLRLQRKCACGNQAMAGSGCRECDKKKRLGLQTKLTVNEPGDVYEREADRVADQVMGTHAKSALPELEKAAKTFENGEADFPQHLSAQKAADVRKAIFDIKAATATPELRHIR